MLIALISDTHLPSVIRQLDELGPEIGDFLADADLILHAGDVTAPPVLDWCEMYAPTLVAEGNNDLFEDPRMAKRQILDVEGWRIAMVHEIRPRSRPTEAILETHLDGERPDVLISGDTHVEYLDPRDDLLLVNPGSPTLPHHKEFRLGTVGLLNVQPHELTAEIRVLGQTPGAPNPGNSQKLVLSAD
ncbi:metallophosphatase family protein [Myxococcota bacterium]|nr:metallophosphatase family protein [Myxococcota bacterium]